MRLMRPHSATQCYAKITWALHKAPAWSWPRQQLRRKSQGQILPLSFPSWKPPPGGSEIEGRGRAFSHPQQFGMNRMKSLPISSSSTIQEDSGWRRKLWLRIGQRSVWLINLICTEAYWTVIEIKYFILISTLQLQLSINSPQARDIDDLRALFRAKHGPQRDCRAQSKMTRSDKICRAETLPGSTATATPQSRSTRQSRRERYANGMRQWWIQMNQVRSASFSRFEPISVWT